MYLAGRLRCKAMKFVVIDPETGRLFEVEAEGSVIVKIEEVKP